MNEVAEKLDLLAHDERRRVVLWLIDYFAIYEDELLGLYDEDDDIETALVSTAFEGAEDAGDEAFEAAADEEPEAPAEPEIDTFAAFFARVAPKTAIQKIVTAAYWVQTRDGKQAWKSFEVNKLLKSIDVKLSSVSGTLALDEKREEPLVETLSKSGDSMQARKTFRLSDAGEAFVESRLA